MLKEIEKYIEQGLTIKGNPQTGYNVFTVDSQHFYVKSLDELTTERLEKEIERQQCCETNELTLLVNREIYQEIKNEMNKIVSPLEL